MPRPLEELLDEVLASPSFKGLTFWPSSEGGVQVNLQLAPAGGWTIKVDKLSSTALRKICEEVLARSDFRKARPARDDSDII